MGEIEDETHLTMHNIQLICEEAGCSLEDIVKCTVHLSDMKDFDRYNFVYASYFKKVKPACTTL